MNTKFLILFLQILSISLAKQDYVLNFEYLLSDEKEIFNIDLFNKPKNIFYDYGENIFYSGEIESIEKYPVSKLINFNKTDFLKQIQAKEEEDFFYKVRKDKYENEEKKEKKEKIEKKEKNEEKKMEENKRYEKKEKNVKNNDNDLNKNNYRNNDLEFLDDFIDDPFIKFFFNDPDNSHNIIRFKKSNKKQKQPNYYNNYYYNNNNHNHNNYYNNKNKNQENNQENNENNNQKEYNYNNNNNNNNNYQIFHHFKNGNNGPMIRIIAYPRQNIYPNNNNNDDYNNKGNNNNNYNNKRNNNNLNNYEPFSIFDDFDFDSYMDDPFKFLENRLNNLYGIRRLSELNTNKKLNKTIFSKQMHHLLFIPNKYYFDYIKYLPKSTIILIPKKYENQIINYENYEDYYIFTAEDELSLVNSLLKTENRNYVVKIGQNYTDKNTIFISIALTVTLCFMGSIIYSYLIKHSEVTDILPVQRLINKFPIFLCLLNIFIYICFIYSYNEYDAYYVIIKYISLFFYSLFRSIFLSLLILLLNGWMTLYFVGWAEKLNRVIPILLYEILSSISFELIEFYNILPYNKLQLYYFRNTLENIIIFSISFISLFKYYYPLNQKCKYLSIISSDFYNAYKLKKRKMLSYIIFCLVYSFISIYSNYFEFSFIYKYIQNDNLHIIKQIILESAFNFIFSIILLPMELPYLFTEETDLLSFGYFFINLNDKNEIMDINNKNIKEIKKEAEDTEDIPIIVVNPFYDIKNGFDNIHTGNIIIEKDSNN